MVRAADKLEIRAGINGRGVYAIASFAPRECIFRFSGPLFSSAGLPTPYDDYYDHYVQIGENVFMGPSGDIDDYFNHSCDPNAALIIKENDVKLIALRAIDVGEEIVWDYSVTMLDDDWCIPCACGSDHCRGNIREFKYLPADIQSKYITLGIVPEYVLKGNVILAGEEIGM